jgi:GT2 family glycosyltransferase
MDDPARPAAPTGADAGSPGLPDQTTALSPSPRRRPPDPVRRLIARWPQPVQLVLRLLWWTATLQLVGRWREWRLSRNYRAWIARYDTIGEDDRRAIARAIAGLADPPLISVVMPVYETPEAYLRAAIDSVRRQLYPHWQLCIADDASTAPHVRAVLEHYRETDRRIEICYRRANGHISAASNSALALAKGEFVALLDHDDLLPEHALYLVAQAVTADPELDLIFSDEDKIDAEGRRFDPYFKPDWNPDLMLSQNMFSHLGVFRRSLVEAIGGFRQGYEGSQDYDLVLRAAAQTRPERIHHIPHVLYHWRAISGSVALAVGEKTYATERARQAITDHLAAQGIDAQVGAGALPNFHRVRYALRELPLASVIIPTRDQAALLRTCVSGLLDRTDYPKLEIIIVDNQSREADTHTYFAELAAEPRVRIIKYDQPFNFAAINNFAVGFASGSMLCLLNNDIEVIDSDWLREMVSHAARPGIGGVGALLYYPDQRIQHAGTILGISGVGAHAYRWQPRGTAGHFGRAMLIQNLSAVTAACFVVPATVYAEVAGLDERNLTIAFNDVDLCLRIGERGYRIVWTPHAELYHHESASRGPDTDPNKRKRFAAEVAYMQRRWGALLHHDPCHNPNLWLDYHDWGLASPPRIGKLATGQAHFRGAENHPRSAKPDQRVQRFPV